MVRAGNAQDPETLTAAIKGTAQGERTIMELDGVRFAIVPAEDAEYMENREDAQDVRDALKELEDLSDAITIDDVMTEYGLN